MVKLENDIDCIPVWPEEGFAELALEDDWKEFKAEPMEIYEFISWMDKLEEEEIKVAAFPLADLTSIEVEPKEMKEHLLSECSQYE